MWFAPTEKLWAPARSSGQTSLPQGGDSIPRHIAKSSAKRHTETTMPSAAEPPPPPAPRWGFLRRLTDALRDVGSDLGSIGKACTCGNPRSVGPCPRHGKLR
jgi:hypothetical protein